MFDESRTLSGIADGGSEPSFRGALDLADWRRRVAEIYAAVRAMHDPAQAWRLWRKRREALFRDHPQSPLSSSERAVFGSLPCFAYDPAARVLVDLDPLDREARETQHLRDDGRIRLEAVARTRGLAHAFGGELTLYWIAGYGGGLFLPFADATASRETYGGGRYLLDTIKGADLGMAGAKLVLDFNFAYNPSCAYSPRWSCPLAPPENRLRGAVRAGERIA
jgi:uncharacterized protein (DUF1684 family)